MAEVPFRPVRQLSEYKGKGASANRERECVNAALGIPHLMAYPFLPTAFHLSDWLYFSWQEITSIKEVHVFKVPPGRNRDSIGLIAYQSCLDLLA